LRQFFFALAIETFDRKGESAEDRGIKASTAGRALKSNTSWQKTTATNLKHWKSENIRSVKPIIWPPSCPRPRCRPPTFYRHGCLFPLRSTAPTPASESNEDRIWSKFVHMQQYCWRFLEIPANSYSEAQELEVPFFQQMAQAEWGADWQRKEAWKEAAKKQPRQRWKIRRGAKHGLENGESSNNMLAKALIAWWSCGKPEFKSTGLSQL
jgi:hypothetical protein